MERMISEVASIPVLIPGRRTKRCKRRVKEGEGEGRERKESERAESSELVVSLLLLPSLPFLWTAGTHQQEEYR